MQYDIDKAIEQVGGQPWELELTIDGAPWAVRPLTVADVDRLGTLAGQGRDRQTAVIADLFLLPADAESASKHRPAIEAWSSTVISHVVAAVIGYQRGRVLKNCQAVASAVATATTKQSG